MDKTARDRAKWIIKDVEFNQLGQPIRDNGKEMQSNIGVLARQKVNINFKSWKEVPYDVKEHIWEHVNMSFNVPPSWKKGCLASANSKWRQYKADLTKYIFERLDKPNELEKPPKGYTISVDDWRRFLISRMTDDFKKVSESQKERTKKIKYPHRLYRKGYAQFAEEMDDELGDVEGVNRAILWMKGRANKKGEFDGEDLQTTVTKIDDYIQQNKEGKLKFKPKEDILTKALDSLEHGGRVRAVGGHINQTVYFSVGNLGKTNSEKDQIIEQHAKRLTQQEKRFSEQDARLERLEVILHKKTEQKLEIDEKCSYSVKFHGVKNEDELVNGKSRLYDEVPYDDDDDVKVVDKTVDFQGKPVVLTLESGTNIAYGTIVSNNGYPLPNNCMHVAIDSAMDESAPLPVQDRLSGCQSIGDAVGNHVACPVHLIKMHDKKHDRKKVALPQKKSDNELQAESMPTSLWVLYCFAKNVLVDGRGIRIPIQSDVFGDDSIIHIYLDDILRFCKLEPISYNCIVGYICTLYKKMQKTRCTNLDLQIHIMWGINHQ